ncbi:caspase recruitment domain-containing protein 9 isoform X2 [Callithrix jacchus]
MWPPHPPALSCWLGAAKRGHGAPTTAGTPETAKGWVGSTAPSLAPRPSGCLFHDPDSSTPPLRPSLHLSPPPGPPIPALCPASTPPLFRPLWPAGVLLDILQRTGHKGYVAFLESLELYYPQLYKKVTGKEPARVFSMIIDASGESGLTQLLMTEVMKLQKKVQDLTALLSSKDDFIKELRVKDSLLRKHQERVQRLKEECEAGSRELKRCKEENYDLAMRLARQSEEKGAALMRNRDLQLEVRLLPQGTRVAPLAWPGGVCGSGAAPWVGCQHLEWMAGLTRPSADRPAQAQPHEGRGRLQGGTQAHTEAQARHGAAAQPGAAVGATAGEGPAAGPGAGAGGLGSGVAAGRAGTGGAGAAWQGGMGLPSWAIAFCPLQEGKLDRSSPYIQVLEEDWRQALRDHQEQASTIFSLRKDLRQGEARHARFVEEKEMLELQCRALRKDCKVYKDRIEAILLQMEEVAVERDQAIATREELHTLHARGLQEKDVLRKHVRELGEKADELQLQLFQREAQLLAVEGRLRRQQLEMLVLSSDLEDGSPRSSQELSLPQDLEEDTQLSDKGGLAGGGSREQPFATLHQEQLSLIPHDAGLSSGEPPEKERRRLKESFENYRRKRALRKMQNGWRQGEADRENTTGSDNTDTEGS